jgi:tetratricopeptide (TPR) repeat protein
VPPQQPEHTSVAEIARILSEAIRLEGSSGPEEAVNLVGELIRKLHQSGQYVEVAKLFESQICQDYEGCFHTFEIAYALNESGNQEKASEIYEELSYADHPGPAVLNNLGVIRKKEGKLREAIRLYRRATKLDPDEKLCKNNLAAAERELSEQVRLKASCMEAAKAVREENEYVVGRLLQFYNNATGDPDYCKGRIPMPRWKFNKMAGMPDNRADAVLRRWVEKGYLRDTGESGRYNERVYELNPYLHKELARLRPIKVKTEWITGFENVTGGNLAVFGYA